MNGYGLTRTEPHRGNPQVRQWYNYAGEGGGEVDGETVEVVLAARGLVPG